MPLSFNRVPKYVRLHNWAEVHVGEFMYLFIRRSVQNSFKLCIAATALRQRNKHEANRDPLSFLTTSWSTSSESTAQPLNKIIYSSLFNGLATLSSSTLSSKSVAATKSPDDVIGVGTGTSSFLLPIVSSVPGRFRMPSYSCRRFRNTEFPYELHILYSRMGTCQYAAFVGINLLLLLAFRIHGWTTSRSTTQCSSIFIPSPPFWASKYPSHWSFFILVVVRRGFSLLLVHLALSS